MKSSAKTNSQVHQLSPAELLAFGQPDAAENQLRTILQKQHDNLEALIELVRLYLFLGEFEKAKEELLKARHQWPGQSRLQGLFRCVERQQKKHLSKVKKIAAYEAQHISTCELTFHLIRFVFCILMLAAAFSIFYYYFIYLDSSSGSRSVKSLLSIPIGTLIIHGLFYFAFLMLIFHAFKNLWYYFMIPSAIAVCDGGLALRFKMRSRFFAWDEAIITRIEKKHAVKKEKWFILDEYLNILPSRRVGLFGIHIPSTSIGQYRGLIRSLKNLNQIRDKEPSEAN